MSERAPRVGVVTFPGSQDDRDALLAFSTLGAEAVPLWHGDDELPDVGAVVLPGGFSYGDYLRAGALARFSPAMEAVAQVRGGRRPRSRHLQRVPDPVRGWVASGRHFVATPRSRSCVATSC